VIRCLLVLCCLLFAGCSASAPIVEGTVTLNGQPVDGGVITLQPLAGTTGANVGGDIKAGKFRLADRSSPAVGKHRAEIRWVRKTGRQVPVPTNPNGSERIDEIGETIPEKYNTQSTLEMDVQPGVNRVEWKLTTQ